MKLCLPVLLAVVPLLPSCATRVAPPELQARPSAALARQLLREELPSSRAAIKRLLGDSGWKRRSDSHAPWSGPPVFPAEVRYDDIESKEFEVEGRPDWGVKLAIRGEQVTGITIMQYRVIDSQAWVVGWWHNPPFDRNRPEHSPLAAFGAMRVAPPR